MNSPRWLPIGGGLTLGLFVNLIGSSNLMARREVLEAVNGFQEDRDSGYEDWEFMVRAMIGGWNIEVIPRILLHCRRSNSGMLRTLHRYRSLMRPARPVQARYPEVADALTFARGLLFDRLSPNLDTADLWRNGKGRD